MASINNKVFKKDNQYYWADKSLVPFIGPETMIFECTEDGEVTNWGEKYCDRTDKTLDECIEEFMNY